MSAANEALVLRWIDCWNSHDVDRLADYVAPGYIHHLSSGADRDLDAFHAGFGAVVRAFPDISYSAVHLVSARDLVAAFLIGTGHHNGPFFGVPPTGDLTTFRGAYHCRVEAGQIAEDWDVFDLLTPVLALGAQLAPPASS